MEEKGIEMGLQGRYQFRLGDGYALCVPWNEQIAGCCANICEGPCLCDPFSTGQATISKQYAPTDTQPDPTRPLAIDDAAFFVRRGGEERRTSFPLLGEAESAREAHEDGNSQVVPCVRMALDGSMTA